MTEGGSSERRRTTISTTGPETDYKTLDSPESLVPLRSVVLLREGSDGPVPPEGPGGSHVPIDSDDDAEVVVVDVDPTPTPRMDEVPRPRTQTWVDQMDGLTLGELQSVS